MKRLDPLLPIIGVVGLIVVWYLAVWFQIVDPVLLPSPTKTFWAFWKAGGRRLGFDFLKTAQRTTI